MPPSRQHPTRAFTILEIMVVVVIIVILLAILIPSLGGIRNHASRAATSATLNAINTGLTGYFNDFSYFPTSNTPAYGGAIPPGRGDQLLAQGLLGYLPGALDGAGSDLVPNPDPSNLGFRTRKYNPAMGGAAGKISGPYAPTDAKSFNGTSFIDAWAHPILYYRSTRSGAPDLTLPTPTPNVTLAFGTGNAYDYYFDQNDCKAVSITSLNKDNSIALPTSPPHTDPLLLAGFFKMLGAPNNTISGPIPGSAGYLLLSAGPDEIFFTPDDVLLTK